MSAVSRPTPCSDVAASTSMRRNPEGARCADACATMGCPTGPPRRPALLHGQPHRTRQPTTDRRRRAGTAESLTSSTTCWRRYTRSTARGSSAGGHTAGFIPAPANRGVSQYPLNLLEIDVSESPNVRSAAVLCNWLLSGCRFATHTGQPLRTSCLKSCNPHAPSRTKLSRHPRREQRRSTDSVSDDPTRRAASSRPKLLAPRPAVRNRNPPPSAFPGRPPTADG